MFRIEEKDYDLNFLLRFDMLKEVLIKLLKNQNNLQNEIDVLKNTNIERDNKILNLEQIITELQDKSSFEESESESEIEKRNEIISEPKEEKKIEEKELNTVNNNIIDSNKENNEQNKEKEKEKEKDVNINNKEDIKNNTINNEEKTEEKKDEEKKEEIKEDKIEETKEEIIKQEIKSPEKEKTDREKNDSKTNNVPSEKRKTKEKIIYSIKKKRFSVDMGQVPINTKELTSRINLLEIKLNNLINNKEIQNMKKELKNHDLENQSDFKVIDM